LGTRAAERGARRAEQGRLWAVFPEPAQGALPAPVEGLLSKGLAHEQEGAIKFKMDRAPILIPDLVVGDVRRELTDREQTEPDFIIVRSDGQPVFHLVNVVDDLEMGITHVIRGEIISAIRRSTSRCSARWGGAAQVCAHPADPEH